MELQQDDAEAIFRCWMSDEEVSRYMLWEASQDIRDAEEFVRFELGNLENDSWNRWLIILRETGQIIGTCLCFFNEEEGHWDISYNLGRKFWGRGYASEAMGAAMDYAVGVLNVQEICTTYAAENPASGRVLEKLGFKYERDVPYMCNGKNTVTTGRYRKYTAK